VTEIAIKLLNEARALQASYPNLAAMQRVAISDLPVGSDPLRSLWNEMLLVQAGEAGTLTVLEDEMAALIESCR
jgi:hypothetical protein